MSGLIQIFDNKKFVLSNSRISYMMQVNEEGILEHLHFGGAITHPEYFQSQHKRVLRSLSPEFQGMPQFSLYDLPQEYPLFGSSDYRQPALHARNAQGNSIFDLRYKAHRILDSKMPLDGLPSARDGECESLEIELYDELQKLSVFLYYTIYANFEVITRSAKILNQSANSISLEQAMSTCLDLPQQDYELLHFGGSWAREFDAKRHELPYGRFTIESARGTSSAQHHPFMAVLEPGASETWGRVIGTALMYSGNFSITLERNEFKDVRLLAGINPFNFSWQLEAGQTFTCPEVVHVYSGSGLDRMSQNLHGFIQNKVSPQTFAHAARPTYLNTWEAAYFDIDEKKVFELAKYTQSLGLDMLVVDDGWFEGRTDDRRSLGDWTPDKKRFPSGIPALAKKVKDLDLKFGIWVEPEMTNTDSALYREHPDWILHVPGRESSLGRNQLTLDFSRPEVVENIYQQLDELFSCGLIDYVKWDMNRTMTELGSAGHPASRQGEIAHRYMLGVYDLVNRLTQKYPDILFENCASGGNRHDLGMLHYMNQSWVSDMSDPIGRLAIQNGASHIFPLSTYSSYLCPVPNHQNGRITSLETRFNVGFFCGNRGVSMNLEDVAQDESAIKNFIQRYKHTAKDAVNGSFHRIFYTDNEVCWQLISADKQTIYVGYFSILTKPNAAFRSALLRGLDQDALYKKGTKIYSGSALMQAGLDLPLVSTTQNSDASPSRLSDKERVEVLDGGDFVSTIIVLEKS